MFTYFSVVLSLLRSIAAPFVLYVLLASSLKCACHVKKYVAAVACAVPLAEGVRYLDRFSAYGPLAIMGMVW